MNYKNEKLKKSVKTHNIGSIKERFVEIRNGDACLSGAASRKTKRSFKRIASRANRTMIKKYTREELKDFY